MDTLGGRRAVAPKRQGRPTGAGRLCGPQITTMRQQILDKMPDQLKVGFYLWTRAAVVALIAREYRIVVSLATVGRSVKAWGFIVQKPVRRAYERKDVAIMRWLRTECPAIVREAKREGATISWGDAMGLRRDHVKGTSDAPVGQTPVVRATRQRVGSA